MKRLVLGLVLTAWTVSPAHARPASKGPYAEVGMGGRTFLGDSGDAAALGMAGSLHVGIDVFPWFSVGLRTGLSTHEATVPAPPVGEYFQIYSGAVEGRLALRLEWLEVFIDGSFGGALISTNVLEKVGILDAGERFSSIITGGGGFEYQMQNRHYALGLAGEWSTMPAFDKAQSITARAYLRYTY